MDSLSIVRARRIALAAQGFADPRPNGPVTRRHLRRVFDRVGLIQIDSVNVLQRSQYLPVFARLGAYDTRLLDDMAYRHRELFEYWGHEASLIPVRLYPLFHWHMARASQGDAWGRMTRMIRERPDYIQRVLEDVRANGPMSVSELHDPGERAGDTWGWNWKDGKVAIEYLFWAGEVAAATRVRFERRYDIPERVIPAEYLNAPEPTSEDAQRQLLEISARSLGVGTGADIADYFRIRVPEARPRIHELEEEGVIRRVQVEGWRQPALLHREAKSPRALRTQALLSPFDSLIWFRDRTLRLFDMHYRIGIYTPAHLRTHGYYVLPFLLDEQLVARVDLKSDRKQGVLLVQSAHLEEHQRDPHAVAGPLANELRAMSAWLGLGGAVKLARRGDGLARALAQVLGD
jgi:hypothetical protein